MKHLRASSLLLIGLLCVQAQAADVPAAATADTQPAWPQANGPFGNFNPRQYGVKLVDDLKQARQIWVSETAALGRAKGSASGYVDMLADPTTHAGSASGLIVAEGKVFASSFRPRGDAWAEKMPHLAKGLGNYTGERLAALQRNTALDADDLTIAVDFATGRTLWKAVEEGKGLNRAGGKRLHFHATPAYAEGRVFSLGTLGRVYCYAAATGRKLWEDDTGSLVKPATALKEKLLRERNDLPGGQGMGASLVVADGVLIVPQYPGAQDVGLRGMDGRTGKTLWEVPSCNSRFATPAIWTHKDKSYVLVATIKGELRLIDPATGRVLWTVTGLEPVYYPLAPSARHVLVNIKSATDTAKRKGQSWGRVAAYRLSPEKAERAWEVPDRPEFWFENHMDICAMRRVLIRDGRVYYFTQGHTLDPAKSSTFFHILDEQTGAVLLTNRDMAGSPQFFLIEDRLLYSHDAAHFKKIDWEFYTTDPRDFRRIGPTWTAPHNNTTGYEVFIELPYVDGRFLMRTWQGQIVCYELRQP